MNLHNDMDNYPQQMYHLIYMIELCKMSDILKSLFVKDIGHEPLLKLIYHIAAPIKHPHPYIHIVIFSRIIAKFPNNKSLAM